jgi:nitrate reductase gamma subunit
MNNRITSASQIILWQGILITLFGVGFIVLVIQGYFYQTGFLFDVIQEPMIYIGLFEAYGLATVCGIILIILSRITLSPFRHLIAALIDVQFLLTSIIFWNYYKINQMEIIGYSSLLFHAMFGTCQIIFFTKAIQNKLCITDESNK